MRPSARVQAAIELLDATIDGAKNKGAPADRLISEYFKKRRYAGSKDRRAVRELVYAAIRACGPVPKTGRTAMMRLASEDESLAALFDGSTHSPPPIGKREVPAEGGTAPQWLLDALTASGISEDGFSSLMERAPLDVRVNTLKAERDDLELPEVGEPLGTPNGLRFATGTKVEQWDAHSDGRIEIQDHGSQLVCTAMGVQAGENVIDLCAGAGGKTLGLAAAMDNTGRLVACDIDRKRLSQLPKRAERAGASMIETLLLNPGEEYEMLEAYKGKADAVLVDAPCSGTGTWRRNPEGRWRLDPKELDRLAKVQDDLLDLAAGLVTPGGRLTYVTCSLLDAEGTDRIEAFLTRHEGFEADTQPLTLGAETSEVRGKGMRLTPYQHGTDGFFVATLKLAC